MIAGSLPTLIPGCFIESVVSFLYFGILELAWNLPKHLQPMPGGTGRERVGRRVLHRRDWGCGGLDERCWRAKVLPLVSVPRDVSASVRVRDCSAHRWGRGLAPLSSRNRACASHGGIAQGAGRSQKLVRLAISSGASGSLAAGGTIQGVRRPNRSLEIGLLHRADQSGGIPVLAPRLCFAGLEVSEVGLVIRVDSGHQFDVRWMFAFGIGIGQIPIPGIVKFVIAQVHCFLPGEI